MEVLEKKVNLFWDFFKWDRWSLELKERLGFRMHYAARRHQVSWIEIHSEINFAHVLFVFLQLCTFCNTHILKALSSLSTNLTKAE